LANSCKWLCFVVQSCHRCHFKQSSSYVSRGTRVKYQFESQNSSLLFNFYLNINAFVDSYFGKRIYTFWHYCYWDTQRRNDVIRMVHQLYRHTAHTHDVTFTCNTIYTLLRAHVTFNITHIVIWLRIYTLLYLQTLY